MPEPISEREALQRIIKVADQQLDLLEDAHSRSDVDVRGLSRTSLELLLEAMATFVGRVEGEDFSAFSERFTRMKAQNIDVRRHMIELGAGWQCRSCKSDVVGGVIISGVKKRKVKLELRCKACGEATPIGRLGHAAFKKRFGHMVEPGWNPQLNGFICPES